MAFSVEKVRHYEWPVEIRTPADGGRWDKETFTALFKRLKVDELKALTQVETPNDVDVVKHVMVGWADIKDAEGKEYVFNDHNLNQLLQIPSVAAAIVTAYLDSINGAPRKN
jgi:hypothetical protein